MPYALLRLLWVRAGRALKDGGWRLLVLTPFLMLLLAQALLQLARLHPAVSQGALAVLLPGIHFGRKDAAFLQLLGRRARVYIVLESLLWLLPLGMFFWVKYPAAAGRLWVLLPLFVALGLYFIPPGNRFVWEGVFRPARRLTGLLPVDLYEWKAVLRRYFGLFLLLYGASLAALVRVPVGGVALLVFALLFSGNLEWTAPPEVQLGGGGSRALAQKIRRNVIFFTALALPLIVVQVLLYPRPEEMAFLFFCFVVAQVLCLYFLLLPSGAFPQPLSAGQRVIAPILFCIAAPLLPLSFYLLYQKYRKATWALQPYWS